MNVYYTYILASKKNGTLYTGVTNNMKKRLQQHRQARGSEFTSKYAVHRLVHIESFRNPSAAIAREKQIKSWKRDKKIALIERANPEWRELAIEPI
jgi:putative endonuclease